VTEHAERGESHVDLGMLGEGPASAAGPLPSPEVIRDYEQVLSGAADRIMTMMEHQAEHRMDMERALVEGAVRTERLGQVFGLGVVLLAFLVSAWLITHGHSVAGTVLGVTDLVGLVAVFAKRGDSGDGAA
jgi:uncharacterized membrane protein